MQKIIFALIALMSSGSALYSQELFDSGSTGADGALDVAVTTEIALPPNGIFNFTTVRLRPGVTLRFKKNAANTPVHILATGDILVEGILDVNGKDAFCGGALGKINLGGEGGPGGFSGGDGGIGGVTPTSGGPGQGPNGGKIPDENGRYSTSDFPIPPTLIPLLGGSGGAGSNGNSSNNGCAGTGGGGALLLASSSKITVTNSGLISARGAGNFVRAGSGGAIRLVASEISGNGTILADATNAFPGAIRMEAFLSNFSGSINPAPSVASSPGAPIPSNVPTVKVASIGGVSSPANPTGSTAAPDVVLSNSSTNPVTVSLAATHTPPGTVFKVRVTPRYGTVIVVNSDPSTGTQASSQATASVILSSGVSTVAAFSNFTVP